MPDVYSYTFSGTLELDFSANAGRPPPTKQISGQFTVDYDQPYSNQRITSGEVMIDGVSLTPSYLSAYRNSDGSMSYNAYFSYDTQYENETKYVTILYSGQTPTSFTNVRYGTIFTDYLFYPPVTSQAYYDSQQIGVTSVLVCYCRGTRIRTVRGDVAVEALAIGDHVVTASGAHRPIRWIGQRAYAGRFVNANADHLPICFKAGALADGLPIRDLWVSPKHAMFLDGVLVPAEHLVNGVSIVKAERVESVEYWHVELDSHDVLIAEGAASESYVDDDNRGMFLNARTFSEMYPETGPVEAVYCAPRVEDGYVLEAVRRRLDARAGLPVAAAASFGALHGAVEGCDGTSVWGWARDADYPDAPVCLDVIVDGVLAVHTYADGHRADLAPEEIGDGCHGFAVRLPAPPSASVTVRRSADGAVLMDLREVASLKAAA